jgi:hypothetical protein
MTRVTFIISDTFSREASLICRHISDASRQNVSLSLSVTRLVHPRHRYGHISVTRLSNTRHRFYQWRVLSTRVADILLLVTRLDPRAWATANQWRVSLTRVTDILLVTRFVSESLIEASLISFSGIVKGLIRTKPSMLQTLPIFANIVKVSVFFSYCAYYPYL